MPTKALPALLYREGPATFSKIEYEIDRLWDEAVGREGFERVRGTKRAEAIWLQRDGGIIAEAVAVAVYFQPAINEIVKDIWREFILPGLKKRFGDDVLEEAADGSASMMSDAE